MRNDLFNPNDDDGMDTPSDGSHAPADNPQEGSAPLADRMRPKSLSEVIGQEELLGKRGPLRLLLAADSISSVLLWGPPGCGKTTLARLVARHTKARFLEYSAVAVGSKELKQVMSDAAKLKQVTGQRTILFLDEIHRFNKAQQDTLLPWVERGDVVLIGATTENPSFEVNSALLSRTRLFVLQPLNTTDVCKLLQRAIEDPRGLQGQVALSEETLHLIAEMSEGDGRAALGILETIAAAVKAGATSNTEEKSSTIGPTPLEPKDIAGILLRRTPRYDKGGEEHFNIISALHKSMRNSDVQASLYWLARMLEGGEDPLYIVRRLVRFASEDVGLADPGALTQAMATRDAVHFIGMPEGALALSQAVVYLTLAPKSNALYKAYKTAAKEVAGGSNPPVPLHLRNAPTKLMKNLGFGDGYIYAHDTNEGIGAMSCLPDSLKDRHFFEPRNRGFESELSDRMEKIRQWHLRRRTKENKGD